MSTNMRTTTYQDEFPGLSSMGLYASDIRGDGNCLFNALSDQLYGHQDEHAAMRARTISYMRSHPGDFRNFLEVNPGGGTRRNPKRKNAGAFSQPTTVKTPTSDEIDRVWEERLTRMARGGSWGDNMEIVAFAREYNAEVRIYQRDFAFNIAPDPQDAERKVLHIAYHNWQHYSSIRNLDGPHTGFPEVRVRATSPDTEEKQKEKLAKARFVLPWQVDAVFKSLPYLADKPTIRRALEEANGNIDNAVSKLIDQEDGHTSRSSTLESSSVESIEREKDSDDDEYWGPNKRRARRVSKTSKSKDKKPPPTSHLASVEDSVEPKDELKDGLSDGLKDELKDEPKDEPKEPEDSKQARSRAQSPQPDAESEREWHSDSEADMKKPAPAPQRTGPVRIKLTLPKPPPELAEAAEKAGKSHVKQVGPRPKNRKANARDKRDMMKKAQKAARKERAQATAKSSGDKALPIITKAENKPSTSPELGGNMRILSL